MTIALNKKTYNQNKVDVLVSWQEEAEKKANRLIVLMLLVALLYNYYGFLVPIIAANRLEKMIVAKQDLVHIASQFEVLSGIYSRLTILSPSAATQDMRIFQDQIIPTIESELDRISQLDKKDESLLVNSVSDQRRALSELAANIQILSELYNVHLNQHPRDIPSETEMVGSEHRETLTAFRNAFSKLLVGHGSDRIASSYQTDRRAIDELQAILVGPGHPQDDPVFELELLLKLEKAIQGLMRLSATNEDFYLCDLARNAYSGTPEEEMIRLGNSLTDTFKPYRVLTEAYTDITLKLQYSPSQGLASCKTIKDLIAPPFEIRTIDDLSKLSSFSEVTYEKNLNELEQTTIEVPVIKTTFDRTILISIIPFVVLVLLHLTNSYFSRSALLLNKATSQSPPVFSKQDFLYVGPHFYLTLRESVCLENANPIQRLSLSIRTTLVHIIKFIVILAPTSVCFVYFNYIWHRAPSFQPQILFISWGSMISILMLAELIILNKQWYNLFNNNKE